MKLFRPALLACAALSFAATATAQSSPTPAPAVQRMVTVELTRPVGVEALLARDFDVIYSHPSSPTATSQRFDVIATDEEIARLSALELPVTVVHEDLARFYEERLLTPDPNGATAESGSTFRASLLRATCNRRLIVPSGAWKSPLIS